MPRDALVLKIQRELCHPKCARKGSELSRNGPQTFSGFYTQLQKLIITARIIVHLIWHPELVVLEIWPNNDLYTFAIQKKFALLIIHSCCHRDWITNRVARRIRTQNIYCMRKGGNLCVNYENNPFIIDVVACGSGDFSPPYRWIIHKMPYFFSYHGNSAMMTLILYLDL